MMGPPVLPVVVPLAPVVASRRGVAAMARQGGRGGRGRNDDFEEQVVQVQRVTKVCKGGNTLSFRATVVVGNRKGSVGVGVAKAKEVVVAVEKAIRRAKKDLIRVPITRNGSVPHETKGRFKAGKIVLCPSTPGGFGVVAGGSPRVVLELAGYRNVSCKQVGCSNVLTNAKACIEGLKSLKTFEGVAKERGISVEELIGN